MKTRLVALHLIPGLAIAAFYALGAPLALRAGFPRVFALLLAFLFIGIPIQLALMRRPIEYREPMPWWQYILGTVVLIGILIVLLRVPIGRVSDFLAANVFAWLPPSFSPSADEGMETLPRSLVLVTLILQLVVDGIVNPLVEETYFRGYLLPKLESLGIMAPVVGTALFALAHFWQPHNYVSIFIYVLPLTIFTWVKKNFYVQAFIHCLANSIGATAALIAFVRSG